MKWNTGIKKLWIGYTNGGYMASYIWESRDIYKLGDRSIGWKGTIYLENRIQVKGNELYHLFYEIPRSFTGSFILEIGFGYIFPASQERVRLM